MAKASIQNGSDGEGWRLGERSGLDTLVALAVNAVSYVLHILRNVQCRSEGIKLTTWEVRSQDWNLKELAGAHYKEWSVRFNRILPLKSYQKRRQDEGQIEGLT